MSSHVDNSRTIRLTLNDTVCFLFWLFYFIPPCVERISGTMGMLSELLCIVFFIFFMILNSTGKVYVNRFHIALMVFLVWCTFCVGISSFSSLPYFVRGLLLPVLEVALVVSTSVRKNGFEGLKPLYYVCCIYIFLHFVSMIFFRGGMFSSAEGSSVARAQWVLGSKNNIPIYEVIFTTVIMAFETIKKRIVPRKRNYSMCFVAMAVFGVLFSGENGTAFFQGSSTGIMAMTVCIVAFIYLKKLKMLPRLFNVINTIIGAIAVNTFLLGGLTSPFVNKIITEVFGKSVSFSGRTIIWQTNLSQIPESPIWGYGLSTFEAPVYTSGILTTTTYTYNMFIKYMINYGIVSMIILIVALLCIRKANTTLIQLLNVGFIGIIVIGTMNEVSLANMLFFPIIMSALAREAELAEKDVDT